MLIRSIVSASISATPNGANLTLSDADGKPRMVFTAGKEGSGLVLLDANQGTANKGVRAALSAYAKPGPSLSLFGEDSSTPLALVRTKTSAAKIGSGSFVAINEENRPVAFPRGKAVDSEEVGLISNQK